MEQAGAFRHELKYALSPGDELALRRRIRAVIPHDAHAGPDGRYRIRSIYFDNIYDKALREKIDGVQKREKFRIRYYNDDLSYIVLEKKFKYNALCQKLEAPLTLRSALRPDQEAQMERLADVIAADVQAEQSAEEPSGGAHRYVCKVCGYVYEGDSLPEDYKCPLCGAGADYFRQEA